MGGGGGEERLKILLKLHIPAGDSTPSLRQRIDSITSGFITQSSKNCEWNIFLLCPNTIKRTRWTDSNHKFHRSSNLRTRSAKKRSKLWLYSISIYRGICRRKKTKLFCILRKSWVDQVDDSRLGSKEWNKLKFTFEKLLFSLDENYFEVFSSFVNQNSRATNTRKPKKQDSTTKMRKIYHFFH